MKKVTDRKRESVCKRKAKIECKREIERERERVRMQKIA